MYGSLYRKFHIHPPSPSHRLTCTRVYNKQLLIEMLIWVRIVYLIFVKNNITYFNLVKLIEDICNPSAPDQDSLAVLFVKDL